MAPEILYTCTEGPIIAAKIRDSISPNETFIRMGISFPLDEKYKSVLFKPEENYCNAEVLSYLFDLGELIDKERKFLVRKTDVCYGGSVKFVDVEEMKGKESVYMFQEPIKASDDIYLNELKDVCGALSELHKAVALYKTLDTYLSAAIGYNHLTEKFGASIDVLDIKIPRVSLGCRVEFVLPEELYNYKKIEDVFDSVANLVGFGKLLAELEQTHKDFLGLVEQKRERKRLKVVKKVKV